MLTSISRAVPTALLFAALGPLALAQAPAGVKGAITGTASFTSFVEDMDRTLAFYHDAFGMDVPAIPASGQRPYNQPNPQLFKFFDIPGAKERHQSARIPNTRVTVEVMEIQQVPHQTLTLRMQDPGNAAIILYVRDIDAALARATAAKATMATPSGKPVTLADGTRAILIRDIDGRFLELRQSATPAGTGDVLDERIALTVADLDKTIKVYRDVLGFKVEGETKWVADAALRSLTGLTKAQVRTARVQAPGSQLWLELTEYKGVDRRPLVMKIQDRGAARLQIRVNDTDAVVDLVKSAGLKVHSEGGIAQPIPPNMKGALIADPNNFFLTAFAACDGCAPGLGLPPNPKGKAK